MSICLIIAKEPYVNGFSNKLIVSGTPEFCTELLEKYEVSYESRMDCSLLIADFREAPEKFKAVKDHIDCVRALNAMAKIGK